MNTNITKAIILMLLSSISFALMGMAVKLTGDLPTVEKAFFRSLVTLIISYMILKTHKVPVFSKERSYIHLVLRSLLGLFGVLFYFYAISNLQLADSIILNKLSPFFVTIFAVIFLHEKLTKIQIIALILSFSGATFIIKPQFDFKALLPALSGLTSAIFAGGSYTVVRHLNHKHKERPETIVFYFSLISTIALLIPVIIYFKQPSYTQYFFLFMVGLFASGGQMFLTYAYKYAPASEVSIVIYSTVAFAALLGYMVWKEVPDIWTILGTFLIISGSLLIYLFGKFKNSTKM